MKNGKGVSLLNPLFAGKQKTRASRKHRPPQKRRPAENADRPKNALLPVPAKTFYGQSSDFAFGGFF